jgi:hypothetical protein
MEASKPVSIADFIRGKRVLDIGDEGSPFIADELAPQASAWHVTGRRPAGAGIPLPSHCTVTDALFDPQALQLEPSSIDVILFACPSPSLNQDEACLKWATDQHLLILLTNAQQKTVYGSPGFWEATKELIQEQEFREASFSCIVFRKTPSAATLAVAQDRPTTEAAGPPVAEASHRRYPRKGERYRLAPSYHWPNKRPGDKPPVIVISSNWTKTSGHAEIVGGGGILSVRLGDLGTKL